MQFFIAPMNVEDARIITGWRYKEPYTTYNMSGSQENLEELLDRRSPYFSVRDENKNLIGFYSFGTSALVWDNGTVDVYIEDHVTAIGLGMQPDLTGQGLGTAFVQSGLDFARQQFAVRSFRLYVYPWNKRAIKVYEKVGFQKVGIRQGYMGKEFLEMKRPA